MIAGALREALDLPDPGDHSPEAVVRCSEAIATLRAAVVELSDRRVAVARQLYAGRPAALAQVLGIHPATAQCILARATGRRVNHTRNARRAATAKRWRANGGLRPVVIRDAA